MWKFKQTSWIQTGGAESSTFKDGEPSEQQERPMGGAGRAPERSQRGGPGPVSVLWRQKVVCIEVDCIRHHLRRHSSCQPGSRGELSGARTAAAVHQTDSSAKLRTAAGQPRAYRGRWNRQLQAGYRRKIKCIRVPLQQRRGVCSTGNRPGTTVNLRQSLTSTLGQSISLRPEINSNKIKS